MPKAKTKKSVVKKFKVSGSNKVFRKYTKQNHFNSKQTGNFKRKKRKDQRLFKGDEKNILKAIQ